MMFPRYQSTYLLGAAEFLEMRVASPGRNHPLWGNVALPFLQPAGQD